MFDAFWQIAVENMVIIVIGVFAVAAVLCVWYWDWVTGKLRALKKARHLNDALTDENRELKKGVERLRGEGTAARTNLVRVREARSDLETAASERQNDIVKWRDHCGRLEQRLTKEQQSQQTLQEQKDELDARLKRLEEERNNRVEELEEKATVAAQKQRELEQKAVRLDWRVRQVAQAAGRIWKTPVKNSVPEFHKRTGDDPRHACIISMMNLKGGVGKSTIAANLGATLWKQFDRRVLMIDLDFQSSLTSLCLTAGDIEGLRQDKAFVQRIFRQEPAEFESIYPCLRRIRKEPNCKCELLSTDEDLAEVEEQLMMQWLVGETEDDVRFRLRSILHSDLIRQRYDYIILDCPPRNTTASINALACSDYVMVPVLLDPTSAQAVPRLLTMLKRMKEDKEVTICPEIEILGIVANRVMQDGKLTPDELQVWDDLDKECKGRWWRDGVPRFARAIPDRPDFGRAAGRNELAVVHSEEIKRVFIDLAKQVESSVHFNDLKQSISSNGSSMFGTKTATTRPADKATGEHGSGSPSPVSPPLIPQSVSGSMSPGGFFPPVSNHPADFTPPNAAGGHPPPGPVATPPTPGGFFQMPSQGVPLDGGTPKSTNQPFYGTLNSAGPAPVPSSGNVPPVQPPQVAPFSGGAPMGRPSNEPPRPSGKKRKRPK